ncbi:MAG TPA: hypothetical protein V6D25_31470 [Leptolyngbyaceae cyanobacterium]
MPKFSVIDKKLYTKEWHTKPDPKTVNPSLRDAPRSLLPRSGTASQEQRRGANAQGKLSTDKVIVN